MTKKEFYNNVVEGIRAKLGDEYMVDVREVIKVNLTLDGLIIHHDSENITPTIYLNNYKEHFDSGRPLEDIIQEIISVYQSHRNPEHIMVHDFYDFDNLKDKIIIKVIGTDKNERLLNNIPHLIMGDLGLAVIPYVMLQSDEQGNMGFQIQHNHLKVWDKTLTEIIELAAANTNKMYNFVVKNMNEILFESFGMDVLGCNTDIELQNFDNPMYVLTDSGNKTLGASQLYLKDKIKEFADICECSLYILPSSIHELILIREDFAGICVQELKQMVQSVNATEVSDEDFLSDNLYFYNKETEEIIKF